MLKLTKNLSKQKKIALILSTVIIITIFFFKHNRGTTYTLPEVSKSLNRQIKAYLGNEFEWFLVTPDNVPLYVKETGKGETIVMLHGGFGMTHDYMRKFMKPFENNFHIVYYDQRGSIRSVVPNNDFEKYITLENMVNDLELLRRELQVDKLKLVAHSMGAVLAYEYMKKFPEKVDDIVIISGFSPKFPETNSDFYDLFTSQNERAVFANRKEVSQELELLKQNIDTTTAEYAYLNWKLRSAALQIYDIKKWKQTEGGIGFYNPKINTHIGPESNISWHYGFKFYWKQKQFNNKTLDTTDTDTFNPPINYIPTIKNHTGKIDFMLGTHEVGDWNLRFYKKNITETENIKMHIFKNAGHNIWIDKPKEFHLKLSQILSRFD
jgi:pimeloyl-ACP methyl ester carboxylesterase